MIPWRIKNSWTIFWMKKAGHKGAGRIATRLASIFTKPYYDRIRLSKLNTLGFVSPSAIIDYADFNPGKHIFIDDRVIFYQAFDGGGIKCGADVRIMRDCILQTGKMGAITIGAKTFIQPNCIMSAFIGNIFVGEKVQIAPNCSMYAYNHSFERDKSIWDQPLYTKGGIAIGDDCWIGVNCSILDGVTIGAGAVIGAGSVVNCDIPEEHIASGVPAKIIRKR